MKLAFILFKYFPFGGLQRDFIRIAGICHERGHQVRVYCMAWEGARPEGFDIRVLPPSGFAATTRNARFHEQVMKSLQAEPVDQIVGFNRMPGLDVYYAADTCFEEKAQKQRSWLYRQTERYRQFSNWEREVFGADKSTRILLISAIQKGLFKLYYRTQEERMFLLPPGIARDRCRPENGDEIRAEFRREFGLSDDDRLVLMVGSGFRTKGLDRAIEALAALPEGQKKHTRFFVIGQDKPKAFLQQARKQGVSEHITFFSGRDDVPRFLLGADVLIHPAYNENTGTVLLEALVAGLPVLVTDVCGYAAYIDDAKAGKLIKSPFRQDELNHTLSEMLDSPERQQWQQNALAYAADADIYDMPLRAVEVIEASGERGTDAVSE